MSITLEQITTYLDANTFDMCKESNLFPPQKIMMLINPQSLDKLKLEFEGHPVGLTLESFIWLMINVIEHNEEQRFELIYALKKLFTEIDIDLNNILEWRQLITYIIEEVKAHTEKPPTTITMQKVNDSKQLKAAIVLKPPSYQQSKQLQGKDSDVSSMIKKIEVIESLKAIGILSLRSTALKMYSSENLHFLKEFTLQFEDQNIVDFIIGNNCIVLLGEKKTVKYYDIDQAKCTLMFKNKQTLLVQPLRLWYLPFHNLFLATDHQFKVRNLIKPLRKFENGYITSSEICFTAHSAVITAVIQIKVPHCIVTASMDGKIKLWDMFNQTIISEINHTQSYKGDQGVRGIGVVDGSIIYSWGYNKYINMWIPDKSLIKPHVGQLLVGHMVTDVCTVLGQGMIVSLDCKNIIKVWQIRKLECIQTIQASQSLGIRIYKNSFLTFNSTITFYHRKNELKLFDQDRIPLGGFFNFTYSSFIVITPKQIKSYDAKTGLLKASYSYNVHKQLQTSLSCFMKTSNQRKLYIGDKDGNISIFNSQTGEMLRKLKQGDLNNKVQSMAYIGSQNMILIGSAKLQSFQQQDGITTSLIKDVILPQQVRHIDYNQKLKMFILTFENRYSLWSFETFKLMYDQEIGYDIVDTKFITGYYAFVVIMKKTLRVFTITNDLRVAPCWLKNIDLDNECSVVTLINADILQKIEVLKNDDKDQNIQSMQKLQINQSKKFEAFIYIGKILNVEKKHNYLTLGLVTGEVLMVDLTQICLKLQMVQVDESSRMSTFQFRRKQFIKQRFSNSNSQQTQPKFQSEQVEIIRKFHSHSTAISSVSNVQEIKCLITCSQDQFIKIIDYDGKILCCLDTSSIGANKWSLPFSWIHSKVQELDQVFEMAEKIHDDVIMSSNKQQLKIKALKNMYFKQKQAFNLVKYGYRPQMQVGLDSPTKQYKFKKPQQIINFKNAQRSQTSKSHRISISPTKTSLKQKTQLNLLKNNPTCFSINKLSRTKLQSKLENQIKIACQQQNKKKQSHLPNYNNRPIMRISMKDFRKNNGIRSSTNTPTFMRNTASTKFLKADEIQVIRTRAISKRSIVDQSQQVSRLLKRSKRLPDSTVINDDALELRITSPFDIEQIWSQRTLK